MCDRIETGTPLKTVGGGVVSLVHQGVSNVWTQGRPQRRLRSLGEQPKAYEIQLIFGVFLGTGAAAVLG